jgi:S-adenosylmethionine-diacylgycerolhomoserine-N-methlytransferase
MSILSDVRTLYHLALTPIRGQTHADRLESFYRRQATSYDAFRRRLLPGRDELMRLLDLPGGGVWIDMGGGTGANLDFAAGRLRTLSQVYVVDLCPALLDVAAERIRESAWTNVSTVLDDAVTFTPDRPADVVTFSYSLTMIPDWFAAIDHAARMLKPGGQIGVVDFHVSRKHPRRGCTRHGWPTRSLLPVWFASDNVHLSADHLPYLERRFRPIALKEARTRIPWVPFVRAPYYLFIGQKE